MRAYVTKRYLDLLCSVYLYNEHRGYSGLDRILVAVREKYANDQTFIARIEKHRADEYKHYVMFKRWFQQRGDMPYVVGNAGQIDGIIQMCFGTDIETLDAPAIMASRSEFGKLCRAIALTERRGMRLVQQLMSSSAVNTDPHLMKILKVIERDEPSHWEPYEEWLQKHGDEKPRLRERLADSVAHGVLVLAKFPVMFANLRLPRRTDWPDERDVTQGDVFTANEAARAVAR